MRKVSLLLAGLLLIGVVAVGGTVAAQQAARQADPGVQYKKETRYDFDDDVVEGELQRPDGQVIDARRKAKSSSLIKIRENFIPELLKSAENI